MANLNIPFRNAPLDRRACILKDWCSAVHRVDLTRKQVQYVSVSQHFPHQTYIWCWDLLPICQLAVRR